MEVHKSCSFFGHRNVEMTEELYNKIKTIVENLILNHDVSDFLFGSRSNFNDLCHKVVSDLKNKYPQIKRIAYTCRSEFCVLESNRIELENLHSRVLKNDVHFLGFDQERQHKTKYSSGKASYVERNRAMIDDSDFCVFYYDENYQPEMRKYSKRSLGYYQPTSGTKLAFDYARQKNKSALLIFTKIYTLNFDPIFDPRF